MAGCLRVTVLLLLVTGTLTQDFDLFDALPDESTTAKPKEQPKTPEKTGSNGFNLGDALGPDPQPTADKPAVKPPSSGGGGSFDDSDLMNAVDGGYKPDGGHQGGGGAGDSGNSQGGAGEPQEAGSGQIAAIVSAVGVAVLGAATSFFAYQKKKLCFKLKGGVDPESGRGQGGRGQNDQSGLQVFSNLLKTPESRVALEAERHTTDTRPRSSADAAELSCLPPACILHLHILPSTSCPFIICVFYFFFI